MPSAAPQQGASAYGPGAALSVALAAAGLGVAGRQAMLFTSNSNKGKAIKKAPNAAIPSGLGTTKGGGPGGAVPIEAEHAETEERLRCLCAEIPDREWEVEIRRSDLFAERKREPGLPRG